MDRSNKYIKMCQESIDIQLLKLREEEYEEDDYITEVYEKDNYRYVEIVGFNPDLGYVKTNIKYIWLPKQDQLQQIYAEWCDNGELIKCHNWHVVVLDDFQDWVLNNGEYDTSQFNSMEQLWLAFVMIKIYNKIWKEKESKWVECDLN